MDVYFDYCAFIHYVYILYVVCMQRMNIFDAYFEMQ